MERVETRQVFDLPKVQMEVTEHQVQVKRCSCCGKETRAEFPKEVKQAVQYGAEAKSQMVYLNQEQHIPLKRTCDVFEEFYGHRPAEGTICAAGAEAAEFVKPVTEAIKEHLSILEEVIGNDETGMRIRGYLSTARKNGQMALAALRLAFMGTLYLPNFVAPCAV